MKIVLTIGHCIITGIENKKNRNGMLEKAVKNIEEDVKANPEKFLGTESMKAYQQFIDSSPSVISSTDIAPAILVNMVLARGKLPTISRVVDSMNIVSIKYGVTVSIWNADTIKGEIVYRKSAGGEKYWPFMGEEVNLLPDEVAAFDDEKVLCLVRYRDSKYAPVMPETKNIVIHIQGVEGMESGLVAAALDELEQLILATVGGNTKDKKIFTCELP